MSPHLTTFKIDVKFKQTRTNLFNLTKDNLTAIDARLTLFNRDLTSCVSNPHSQVGKCQSFNLAGSV